MHVALQGYVDGAVRPDDFHAKGQGTVDVAKHPHGTHQAMALHHGTVDTGGTGGSQGLVSW